jgi:aspartyl-tRNA synthetase
MAFISFFEAQSVQTESNGIKIITKSSQTLKKATLNWRCIHPRRPGAQRSLSCRPWIWTSCRKHLRSLGWSSADILLVYDL